jgi:hypothetical protein
MDGARDWSGMEEAIVSGGGEVWERRLKSDLIWMGYGREEEERNEE